MAVLYTVPAFSQEHSVSGTVTDTDGNPVIGAAVMIPGSNTGVTTDIDGSFTLGGIAPDTEIEVSCLGFATQRVKVGNRSEIDFTLEVEATFMDEVVVIGYGTTTRRRSVGAVDQVKADILENRSVANLTQALQGTSPSLVIQQRSFNPNDQGLNINIRGVGTMNNNDPLIVIDGLVTDNSAFASSTRRTSSPYLS